MEFVKDLSGLYLAYDAYATNCEKNSKVPAGFIKYVFSCLSCKAL